ncbi:histidine phosphatase family protein [Lentibacillus amyloliquefaciens]|uniref:Phosphoglycerate mutase n=1 Tax=Lentibacillus amyloliquefaciens TaxID=1472767 RepID=A0A0U4E5L6_9BACI|nr:histidine phosphatase family protein [Lentibacillus amyloliquefaciens]ALX48556.1 phosphoglycerate mutase [Lentibacillus amyloliquefaciens]
MDRYVAVTLFRHGVTAENLEKKYLGWSDPPITKKARRALKALRSNMPRYDFCVSSDLARCRQTADILCQGSRHMANEAFREMNFGQWELKTYADLCHDAAYQKWLDDPFSKQTPDGESFADMEKRVLNGWHSLVESINDQGYGEVLLVTHGGVIRSLLIELADEAKSFWQWYIPHGNGIRLSWTYHDWKEGGRCTSLQVVPSMENENG